MHPAAQQIEFEVGQLQGGLLQLLAAPAQQGAHPGEQFDEGERLHQVIVGALFEAAHAVLYGIAGGQEQHRYGHPGVAHAAQDLPAVTAGQHDVEDQQVVVAAQGQLLALVAIVAQVDGEACLGEPLAQVLADARFVFDDQQFHVHPSLHLPAMPTCF